MIIILITVMTVWLLLAAFRTWNIYSTNWDAKESIRRKLYYALKPFHVKSHYEYLNDWKYAVSVPALGVLAFVDSSDNLFFRW
jgi:hypothetical protein